LKALAKDLILTLDQGTTSSRALLFDRSGHLLESAQYPFGQLYPQPGWVEQDPMEILSSQLAALTKVLVSAHVDPQRITALGITNQRETTVIWDRRSHLPIANAIVWQCRRTAAIIDQLCSDPTVAARITALTGLIPDAYFSASKIAWLLDNTLVREPLQSVVSWLSEP
jgi:glycerol kinase